MILINRTRLIQWMESLNPSRESNHYFYMLYPMNWEVVENEYKTYVGTYKVSNLKQFFNMGKVYYPIQVNGLKDDSTVRVYKQEVIP